MAAPELCLRASDEAGIFPVTGASLEIRVSGHGKCGVRQEGVAWVFEHSAFPGVRAAI